ncbi:MAG: hypothetical protein LBS62_11120 [Clostridiales bacterium]|nr:hypothetical protein [Clostridiales bacterium]
MLLGLLTKKKKWNGGEIPLYYVENSHEAIIEPVVFEMVQQELARRKPGKGRHSGVPMFSSRIKRGHCGGWYGSKVWYSNSKYRRIIWQCTEKFKGEDKCATPHLDEEAIKRLFVSAMGKLLSDKDEIIANFEAVSGGLFYTGALEAEAKELQSEMAVVAELIQKCIEENARIALDQKEYQERCEALVERFDKAKSRFEEATAILSETKARGETVDGHRRTQGAGRASRRV